MSGQTNSDEASIGNVKSRNLIPIFCLVTATALFRSGENAILTTFAPYGKSTLHLNALAIGLGITVSGVVTLLANIGLIFHNFSKYLHVGVAIGLTILSLATFVLLTSGSFLSYLISAALLGLAVGMTMPLIATLAGRLAGVQPARSLAAFTVAMSGSVIFGPLLESSVLRHTSNSLHDALATFAPFGLVAALLIVPLSSRSQTPSIPSSTKFSPAILKSMPLRVAVLGQVMNEITIVTVTVFGTLIGHSLYKTTPAEAQLSISFLFGVAFLIRIVLLWKPPHKHISLQLRVAVFVSIVSLLALAFGHEIELFYLIMALIGISNGLLFPISISIIGKNTKASDIPNTNTLLFTMISLAVIACPIFLGILISEVGYRNSLITISVLELGLGILLIHTNKKLKKTYQKSPII